MTAIAKRETFSLSPRNFQEALEYSRLMARSDMVPKDYRGKPENVLLAVQLGQEIGLSPMQAVQNISVINGRPSVWGDAMLAIVQAHAQCQDVTESLDEQSMTAVCTVRRRGRAPVSRSFSRADAERAGLWGKTGPWTQYPKRMLQMRARSWACRDSFPDALRGLSSAEEVSDYTVDAQTGARAPRPQESTVVDAEVVQTDSGNDSESALDTELQSILEAIEACKTAADLTAIKPRILALPVGTHRRKQAIDTACEQALRIEADEKAEREKAERDELKKAENLAEEILDGGAVTEAPVATAPPDA